MMDNILYIVPYTAQHGQFILSQQMNHKVLEADKHYINVELKIQLIMILTVHLR